VCRDLVTFKTLLRWLAHRGKGRGSQIWGICGTKSNLHLAKFAIDICDMETKISKERIIKEIQRLAILNNGQPPGSRTFAAECGIARSSWRGIYWSRWSEAQIDAGFAPNEVSAKIENDEIYEMLVPLCVNLKRYPTQADMMLWRRRENPSFPVQAITGRIGLENTKSGFRNWLAKQSNQTDLFELLGFQAIEDTIAELNEEVIGDLRTGSVYLMKSGAHYKIGKSEDIERRVKEIRTQMPESLVLVHTINTDDTAGIERYWHQRFEAQRLNGEWFKLSKADVSAFKKRKFQ
jgi:hypothetical protein